MHNCLSYAYYGSKLWRFTAAGGDVVVPVSGNFSTNEAAVVVRAAQNGTGIALLPWLAASQAVADGALVLLLPEVRVESLGVYAVYLSRRRMPGALRALIEFLSEHMQALRMEGAPASKPYQSKGP